MNDSFTWPVGCAAHLESRPAERPPVGPIVAYPIGCTAGGALVGFLLAFVAGLARNASWAVDMSIIAGATGTSAAAVLLEFAGQVAPLPQRQAQVPRRWLLWKHSSLTAGAFGFLIGGGVSIYLQHATVYVLAAIIVIAPSPTTGMVIGAVYGLSRGLMLVATWVGDRYGRRRVDWDRVGRARAAVGRVLAVAAALAFVIALIFAV
jgi:hypothetical protein